MIAGIVPFGFTFSWRLAVVVALVTACGDQEWSFGDGQVVSVDDAAADAAAAPDAEPCGACGEGERCRDSVCECLPSRTRCGAVCVALVTDPAHCGACDVTCGPVQACRGGLCE